MSSAGINTPSWGHLRSWIVAAGIAVAVAALLGGAAATTGASHVGLGSPDSVRITDVGGPGV